MVLKYNSLNLLLQLAARIFAKNETWERGGKEEPVGCYIAACRAVNAAGLAESRILSLLTEAVRGGAELTHPEDPSLPMRYPSLLLAQVLALQLRSDASIAREERRRFGR